MNGEKKRGLNLGKLNLKKSTANTEKTLNDIVPIEWNKSVITGDEKVLIVKTK